jgi:hypothetical protein
MSKFTNNEIQKIMDHFSNKPSSDFIDDQDNSINNDSSSQTDMLEVQANPLVSAEVSKLTAPIPLTHDFAKCLNGNSSDDFKEVSPSNLLKTKIDYYKMLLKDCAKDCMYFDKEVDSAFHPVEETNDDRYSRYGGYNEYGEHDKDYCYHDGGYKRKTSPMMSPIISSV